MKLSPVAQEGHAGRQRVAERVVLGIDEGQHQFDLRDGSPLPHLGGDDLSRAREADEQAAVDRVEDRRAGCVLCPVGHGPLAEAAVIDHTGRPVGRNDDGPVPEGSEAADTRHLDALERQAALAGPRDHPKQQTHRQRCRPAWHRFSHQGNRTR